MQIEGPVAKAKCHQMYLHQSNVFCVLHILLQGRIQKIEIARSPHDLELLQLRRGNTVALSIDHLMAERAFRRMKSVLWKSGRRSADATARLSRISCFTIFSSQPLHIIHDIHAGVKEDSVSFTNDTIASLGIT